MPNKKAVVRTNRIPNSSREVPLKVLTFRDLWESYVSGNPYPDPNGEYKNQCAIRMSATFHRVGVDMKSFSQKLVKPMPGRPVLGRILLGGKAAATRAYELAEWLRLKPIAGLRDPEDVTGPRWRDRVKGRSGIIFFDGYWRQAGDSSDDLSGGHIDLWNGRRLTNNGVVGVFSNIIRFSFNIGELLWISNLDNSKNILFWEIK